jgi:hypothetical protein
MLIHNPDYLVSCLKIMKKKINVGLTENLLDAHTSPKANEEGVDVCAIEGCLSRGSNPMVGLGLSRQNEQEAVEHNDNYVILPILICDRHYKELMSRYYERRVMPNVKA